MRQIITIGGGGFMRFNSEFRLEKYCLQQTNKTNPKVCFLPQASAEDQSYVVKFYQTFTALGANVSWLSLFGRVKHGWENHLLQQDLIYVGGGNTRSMLALWREWGIDKLLIQAYQRGVVLCGISAGAICWFEQCVTDSVWPLGALQGLNILPGSCCPHYDSEPERRPTFIKKIRNNEILPGIALSDHTAAHYVDSQLKAVVSEHPDKKAFYVSANGEEEALNINYL